MAVCLLCASDPIPASDPMERPWLRRRHQPRDSSCSQSCEQMTSRKKRKNARKKGASMKKTEPRTKKQEARGWNLAMQKQKADNPRAAQSASAPPAPPEPAAAPFSKKLGR